MATAQKPAGQFTIMQCWVPLRERLAAIVRQPSTTRHKAGQLPMKGKLILSAGLFQAMSQRAPIRRRGEAIYHKGKGNGENAEALVLKNASFYGNRAVSAAGKAFGGAVYGNAVKITADGGNSVFAGNYANDENNAVYVAGRIS